MAASHLLQSCLPGLGEQGAMLRLELFPDAGTEDADRQERMKELWPATENTKLPPKLTSFPSLRSTHVSFKPL